MPGFTQKEADLLPVLFHGSDLPSYKVRWELWGWARSSVGKVLT